MVKDLGMTDGQTKIMKVLETGLPDDTGRFPGYYLAPN